MGEKKKTLMVLKADLQCCRCYKKVKKVLCKFPEIQDQEFKEKDNLVKITVVCCCPEKLKQKIICKGGGTITCIEIIEPEKKPPKKPEPEKKPPKKPEPEKKPEKQPEPKKQPDVDKTLVGDSADDSADDSTEMKAHGLVVGKPKPPAVPVPAYPYGYGVVVCCGSCSQGGPCQFGHGYGRPPQNYEYGRPVYDSYGGGYRSGYQVSRCDNYFSDENPTGCTVM